MSQFICSFIHAFTQQSFADHLLPSAPGEAGIQNGQDAVPVLRELMPSPRLSISSAAGDPCRTLASVPLLRKVTSRVSTER